MTKEFKAFELRAEKLPKDYQGAWEEIKSNLWQHSDFTGRNIMPIIDSALCILEETSAEGQSVQEALGDGIKGFCLELLGAKGRNSFRDKWCKDLNNKIAKKIGE